MHIILTGGGTAGHVIPNIALIEGLKDSAKISYIGSKKGIENELIKDVDFYSVSTGKLRRYFSLTNLLDFFKVPVGIVESFFLLRKLKPDLIFSKGGYVGLPVVIGGWLARIPVIIHESDAIPGLTTKITRKFAKQFWSSYGIEGSKKVELPIRQSLREGDPSKFKKDRDVLLVMGGSLGADALNEFTASHLAELLKQYDIIHITGKGKQAGKDQEGYTAIEYAGEEMADIYAAADITLCRAGAGTIHELKALGKKAVLVPLPTSKSRGEQFANGKASGYQIINEEFLTLETLNNAIANSNEVVVNEKALNVADLLKESIS